MANTIRLKSGSGNNPSASDLVVGEVALRTDGNPKLFTKNDAGNVLEVGLDSLNDKLPLAGGTLTGDLTISSAAPKIFLTDTNNNDDYEIRNDDGTFTIRNSTDGNDMISVASNNTTTFTGNCDFSAGIDVTGDINCTSDLILDSTNNDYPRITLHSNATGIRKYAIINGQGWNQDALLIYDVDGDNTRLTIEPNGLGINRGANSISHGLDVGGTAMIRGNTEIRGNILLSGDATTTSQERTIDFTGFDKEGTTDFSDRAYIRHTTNAGGLTGSVLLISSANDANDGIALSTNNHNNNLRLNGNIIWNAGNDGSGTGLDADLLDGLHASSFIRSDLDDTASGDITFSGALTFSRELTFSSDSDGIFLFGGGRFYKKSGTGVMVRLHDAGTPLQVESNSGTVLGTFWHSGNDGAGTGLDADLLDGLQGSSYLRSDTSDTFTGDLTVNGVIYLLDQIRIGDDVFIEDYNAANSFRVKGNQDSNKGFIAFGSQTKQLGCNGASAALTYDGNNIWHAGNDGSGSGLDADKLDGQDGSYYTNAANLTGTLPALDGSNLTGLTVNNANTLDNLDSSQFLRSDAVDSSSANITINGVEIGSWVLGSTYRGLFHTSQSGSEYMIISQHDNTFISATTNHKVYIRNGGNDATNQLVVGGGNDALTWRGNKVFHAGNDGSGSGLDSDTVDGIQGGSFLRGDVDDTTTAHLTFNRSIDAKFALSGSNNPFFILNEGTTQKARFQWSESGYVWIQNHEDNSVIVLRDNFGFSPDAGSTIHSIFHAGNDGSGSGLDADTLDGVQGSNYLRSDTDDTFSANLTVDNGTSTTLSVKCDNAGLALIRANGDSQGTGAVEVGQADTYGGGIAYNGDGSPSFASGESDDHIMFYRLDNGTRTEVFHYPYNSNTVNFNATPTVGGVSLVKTNDTIAQATNASTLDSLDSSQFVRSDANDLVSGLIQLTSGSQYPLDINGADDGKLLLRGSNNPYIRFREGNTDKAYIQWNANGWLQLSNQETGESIRIKSGSNGLKFLIDGNENDIWHAGNDGSGSGLDADTLDGFTSGQFLRSDTNHTTTGNLTISKSGATLTLKDTTTGNAEHAIINFDENNNQGVALKHVEHDSDLPIAGYGLVLTASASNTQFPNTGTLSLTVLGNIYAGATSMGSVSRVLTTADEGSGNGIDADTLDGVQGSSFLRSDADDSFSGILTNNSRNEDPSVDVGAINLQPSTSGGRTGIIFRSKVNHTSDHGYVWYFDDLDAYRTSGNSSENGVLLIGIQNDAANAVSSDTVAIESSGDIFLNPGIGTGKIGANSHNSTAGNLYIGNAATKYKVFHAGAHSLPDADNTYDLGSSAKRFRFIYTTDIQLSNENTGGNEVDGTEGTWTLQEGEDDIYMINRKNGKRYKIKMEEV